MGTKGLGIYVYDLNTREFKSEHPSLSEAEGVYKAYRGAITDCLRRGGIHKTKQLIFSTVKYDAYPKMGEIKKIEVKPTIQSDIKPSINGLLTEEQLRQKHDMFFIVWSYVQKIPVGKFVEEGQMLRELGLYGKARYRDAIGRVELKDNKGKVDGTIYYGNVESIKKLKQEGVLQ